MCLYSKRWLPKLALHDIPIRKTINKDLINGKITYLAPIQGAIYGYNLPLVIKPDAFYVSRTRDFIGDYWRISRGVIHCWSNDYEEIQQDGHYVGYIPKGTRYWVGANGDLAAKKVIITHKAEELISNSVRQA